MKIALLNDSHCGSRNSAEWMIDYQERFYSKIFFPYLQEHNIKQIIHLGDYYDSRKTGGSVQAIKENKKHFVDRLEELDIQMDIILGNHDVFYKNTNKISTVKEYLGSFSNNINIIEEAITITYDGVPICLVPWINSENLKTSMGVIKNTDAEICLGHFEFKGFKMQKNGIGCNSNIALSPNVKAFKKFKKVVSAHFHHKSKKGNVEYLGSQMEFTWADWNDPKFFHILDTETLEIEPVRNPYTLFEKIDWDKVDDSFTFNDFNDKFIQIIKRDTSDEKVFKYFLEEIEKRAIDVKVVQENLKADQPVIDIDDISDTPSLMSSYVKNLETELDKAKIDNILLGLYTEAYNT